MVLCRGVSWSFGRSRVSSVAMEGGGRLWFSLLPDSVLLDGEWLRGLRSPVTSFFSC